MKKRLMSFFLAVSLVVIPTNALADTANINNGIINNGTINVQFSDVKSDNWAYQAVSSMSERNVVNGYEDGSFRPNDSISREEFAKMIANTFSLDLSVTQAVYYKDVPSTRWSYPYISATKEYITGYYPPKGKSFFDPGADATREDVATALVKIMDLSTDDFGSHFKDENKISPKLKDYVNVAADNNLISGYPDGTFRPLNPISRSEVAALLYRAIKGIGKADTPDTPYSPDKLTTQTTNSTDLGKTTTNGPRLWVDVVKEETLPGGNPSVLVKGETEPGATVTINGNEVIVGWSGEFSTDIPVNQNGDFKFEVKSSYMGKTTVVTKSIGMSIAAPKLKLDKPDPESTKYAEFNIWFEWVDKFDGSPALYVNGEKRTYSVGGKRGQDTYSGAVKVNLRGGENVYNLKLANRYGKESATVTKAVYYNGY